MCNQQNHHVQEFRNMLFIKSIKLSKVSVPIKKHGEFTDGFWKDFTRNMRISCLAPWISTHPKRHRASDPSRTRRWKQGRPCCSWRYGRLLARSAACPRKPIEWILEHGIWQSQNTKDFSLYSTHKGLYTALIKRSSILDKNGLHTSKCFSPWFTDPSCILSSAIPRSVCMRTSSALSAMRWSSSHVSCQSGASVSARIPWLRKNSAPSVQQIVLWV